MLETIFRSCCSSSSVGCRPAPIVLGSGVSRLLGVHRPTAREAFSLLMRIRAFETAQ